MHVSAVTSTLLCVRTRFIIAICPYDINARYPIYISFEGNLFSLLKKLEGILSFFCEWKVLYESFVVHYLRVIELRNDQLWNGIRSIKKRKGKSKWILICLCLKQAKNEWFITIKGFFKIHHVCDGPEKIKREIYFERFVSPKLFPSLAAFFFFGESWGCSCRECLIHK